jgi:hypothetical protein
MENFYFPVIHFHGHRHGYFLLGPSKKLMRGLIQPQSFGGFIKLCLSDLKRVKFGH